MSGAMVSNLRLASGFVVFVFVLCHFTSHAAGIISLSAMDKVLIFYTDPWRTLPGTILILAALIIHSVLAVWAVYERRSLKMQGWELFQIISGFAIPFMLAAHVLNTRGGYEAFGLEEGYSYQIYAQWISAPFYGIMIGAAVLVVWVHSCIGWHYWLRYKAWYNRILPLLTALAILIPTLAIAGVVSAGFSVLRLSGDETWVQRKLRKVWEHETEFRAFVSFNEKLIIFGTLAAIGLLLLIHAGRWIWKRASGGAKVNYRSLEQENQREFRVPKGASLLDSLHNEGVAHASVCGGRGRCSTCRVRIDNGAETLALPGAIEQRILQRIAAPDNVRLACQIQPTSNLSVTALLRPDANSRNALNRLESRSGAEQEIAVLFADIRAFTRISEMRLPFDTAFLLNRYFAEMGAAIEENGGHLDKFIGDGVMALFGVDENVEAGCRKALMTAASMSRRLENLNRTLDSDLAEPLKIGIGIHTGTAIVGEMGYKQVIGLTAIGDVVNTASRLETLSKDYQAQLVVSEKTVEKSGLDLGQERLEEVAIRGRQQPLPVRILSSAGSIAGSKPADVMSEGHAVSA